jgi:hypothetical protein
MPPSLFFQTITIFPPAVKLLKLLSPGAPFSVHLDECSCIPMTWERRKKFLTKVAQAEQDRGNELIIE